MSSPLIISLILESNLVVRYFSNIFGRDPFRGLYQPNGFDRAILVPYFTVLIILSFYGIHRYWLVYLFMKNRHKARQPQKFFEQLPPITIQLPIYNERYVVERL